MPPSSRSLAREPKTRRRNPKNPKPASLPRLRKSECHCTGDSGTGELQLKPRSSSPPPIRPLGNLLFASDGASVCDSAAAAGLGILRRLPDELLLDLLSLLPPRSLATFSLVSKAGYVLATHDPLWRPHVLDTLKGCFCFAHSWRLTFAAAYSRDQFHEMPRCYKIRDFCFYSDYLFQSWLCANAELKGAWLARETIPRVRFNDMSVDRFVTQYEVPNKPVLIEGCIDDWPARHKWSEQNLVSMCGEVEFSVGPVDMTMDRFFRYARVVREERPLYMFDPKFVEKVPELGKDFEVPAYFTDDLFALLGKKRPDFRWVIIGPAGSGSSFHVDPNSTSAWNAVIKGSKKWIMFPPEVVPPGVHPSPDGSEVACPMSIVEWFMNFYDACLTWERRPVECVCRAGEVVFVPNGWWHLVINLEDSIAITQNFVSRRNLLNVLNFLSKPNAQVLVSGTKDRVNLYENFRTTIDAKYPGMIKQLELDAQEKAAARQNKVTFWESVADKCTGGFKLSL